MHGNGPCIPQTGTGGNKSGRATDLFLDGSPHAGRLPAGRRHVEAEGGGGGGARFDVEPDVRQDAG
jgi:hypothetical protein